MSIMYKYRLPLSIYFMRGADAFSVYKFMAVQTLLCYAWGQKMTVTTWVILYLVVKKVWIGVWIWLYYILHLAYILDWWCRSQQTLHPADQVDFKHNMLCLCRVSYLYWCTIVAVFKGLSLFLLLRGVTVVYYTLLLRNLGSKDGKHLSIKNMPNFQVILHHVAQ